MKQSVSKTETTLGPAELERRRAATMGACKKRFCSCQRFVYSNDAQFCDNCGHSRSMHQ